MKIALEPEEGNKPSWPKVRSIVQTGIKPIYWNLLEAAKDENMVSMIANLKELTKELDILAKYLDLNNLKLKFKMVEKVDTFKSK